MDLEVISTIDDIDGEVKNHGGVSLVDDPCVGVLCDYKGKKWKHLMR